MGACTCTFLQSCSNSIKLPIAWIKGSVAFPRGFLTRFSQEDFPQGCPTCQRGVIRSLGCKSGQCRENTFLWNGLRHLRDSGNGGTFSPFLWREPPLEMRRERPEFFPDQAAKGSLISSYEAESGLLWMWAGPSCFLKCGDGYVGELLELQQGCEGPFGNSRG